MTQVKHLLMVSTLLLCTLAVWGQVDVNAIKGNSRYYSAEGNGVTVEDAERDALAQIARSINVSVSSATKETDNSQLINGETQSNQSQEAQIATVSNATLSNVNKRVLSDEPDAKVFMWVSKADVEQMFADRATKAIDLVATARKAESRLQIDDALRNYYWALMVAKTCKSAVYVDIDGKKENCLTWLPLKIKSVFTGLKASLMDCSSSDGRYYPRLRFQYGGKDVASLQFKYFDGQSQVGPLSVRDGVGELSLVSLPAKNKLELNYEYRFRTEGENLDADIRAAFDAFKRSPVRVDGSKVEVPVKVNAKTGTIEGPKTSKKSAAETAAGSPDVISPEPVKERERKQYDAPTNITVYEQALAKVEQAIKSGKPEDAYPVFTPEGYKLFETMMKNTGKVELAKHQQEYEFLSTGQGEVLGRFCKVKITFSNGKAFNENVTFRFDEQSKKIHSLAYALTRKAEDDIFNAAAQWTDVSRFTILQFMEDYQTAYAFKRLDWLKQVFSDEAIIITGTMLQPAKDRGIKRMEGIPTDFGRTDVRFTRQTKQQYLDNLARHFKDTKGREYIHLTFEDNVTKMINAPRIPKGTAFAIQISQLYNSPIYSDKGYLTLVLDTYSNNVPVIHVRLWQPEQGDLMSLEEFMNKFEF